MSAILLATKPAVAPDEILVVARKLSEITLSVGRDPAGRTTCAISRSSGEPALDEAMCRRAARCLPRRPLPAEKFDACLDKQRVVIAKSFRKRRRS